jgi:mannan endo-1,4-beta-mannosidase
MRGVFAFLSLLGVAFAAQSFAGSSLYYAAGLSTSEQTFLFSNLQKAGVKVLRVWLDGQGSPTKGTTITPFPSLEPNTVGVYNDTVLELLDAVMINAHNYGIKLLISMHSWNALAAGDVYDQWWGTGYFYEQQDAQDAFDNRLRHVLTHTHKTLGKQWKDLSQYIFAFEAENEAMIGNGQDYIAAHQYWQCDRAKTIKSVLGSNSGILVTTGGESWLDESMQPDWFNCAYLDVLAIHAYGTGDYNTSKIQAYVNKAKQSGKFLLFQEWGACYYSTSNNDCPQGTPLDPNTRANNIKNWANQISSAGVPWMYWQILPNNDPHQGYDYEIGVNDQNWDTFQSVASNTKTYTSAFDYSPYLLP